MKARATQGERCYPTGSKTLLLIGYALIVIGVIVLFCCIPCWAWLALIGVVMVVAGYLLVRMNQNGR